MKRSTILAVILAFLPLMLPWPAMASTINETCATRWRPNDVDALHWCATLGYNDTTGEIRAVMFYSEDAGNVYQIYVRNVILWRWDGQETSVKDTCQDSEGCPDFRFPQTDVHGIGTPWADWACGRAFLVEIRFQIQWDAGGPWSDVLSRENDWVSLC